MGKRRKAAEKVAVPPVDPKFRQAFESLMNKCVRASLDLFDHDCTCVFHSHVKDIAKEVKTLTDLGGLRK